MRTGREAYADLNRQVETLRAQVASASQRLNQLSQAAEQSQAEEGRETARLAQFRLDELAAQRVGQSLGSAEREAMVQMAHKQVAQQRCETDIAASVQQQRHLEAQRQQLDGERDGLLAQFEREHAAVAERTRAQADWQALDERADRLSGQAALAEDKAKQAEGDRKNKGQPYEADKLFVYLWRRQFGSAGYRAAALVRTLDGWVAGLIDYPDAARNYRLLLALPEHLRRHADALKAEAQAARAELAQLEQRALEAAGVLAIDAQLDQAETRITELAAAIAAEEKQHAELLRRRGELADGTDEYTRKALAALTRAIAEAPANTLRQVASQTPSSQDDGVVAGIEQARQTRAQLTDQLSAGKREHDQQLQALTRVEELRRRFRNEHYDSGDSELDEGLDWDDVLGGVLRGVLEMTRAWERVQRHQRWRIPKGMRLPGGLPGGIFGGDGGSRGGGFGGGIFKGGGGFGGGGFRSGGGF